MKKITFDQLPDAVTMLTKEVSELRRLLTEKQVSSQQSHQEENLLTREEAIRYLRIASATLWRWEKQDKIQSIGIGGKRYFRKSDINASLIKRKGGNNG